MKPTKWHDGICDVPGCRRPVALIWLDYEICEMHWAKDCDGSFKLRKAFNGPMAASGGDGAKEGGGAVPGAPDTA